MHCGRAGWIVPKTVLYHTSTLSTFLTIWVVWSLEWEGEKIMSKGRIIMLKCDFTSMFPGNHPGHRHIGVGPASPVLAGPLFRQFNNSKFARTLHACLLQLDHFKVLPTPIQIFVFGVSMFFSLGKAFGRSYIMHYQVATLDVDLKHCAHVHTI